MTFTARPDQLPEPLDEIARRPVAFARASARLGWYGLARLTDTGPVLHRLVQAVLRDSDSDPVLHRDMVERLLAAPGDGADPRWWPRWSVLLPHIFAADPADRGHYGPLPASARRRPPGNPLHRQQPGRGLFRVG